MKVAVCYSGQPRVVERTYHEHLKPKLYDCNPDVEFYNFVHTWFDMEEVGEAYINAGGHVASDTMPPDVIQKIMELYTPTKMWVEKQVMFDELDYNERKYPAIVPFFSLSKMNSILRANCLKEWYEQENGMKFDVVISNRTDNAPHGEVILNQFDFSQQILYHPTGCPHPESVNVIFTMGNSDVMTVYSELVEHVDRYWRYDGVSFCDEPLAYHHLVRNSIEPKMFAPGFGLMRN